MYRISGAMISLARVRSFVAVRLAWLGAAALTVVSIGCAVEVEGIDSEVPALESVHMSEDFEGESGAVAAADVAGREPAWPAELLPPEGFAIVELAGEPLIEEEHFSPAQCQGPPITLHCGYQRWSCHTCGPNETVVNVYWKSCGCQGGELVCGPCYWAYDYCEAC